MAKRSPWRTSRMNHVGMSFANSNRQHRQNGEIQKVIGICYQREDG